MRLLSTGQAALGAALGLAKLRHLVLLAFLTLAPLPMVQAQITPPSDPVSGLPIPLLPGQFLLRTQGNCFVIADAPLAEMTNYRWNGACRFGVVQGIGTWYWANRRAIGTYENGYRSFTGGGDKGVDLRRTATQDWEHLVILSRDVRDPEFDIPRGTFHDLRMVEYSTVRNGHFIQRMMLFRRTSCAIGDETGYQPKKLAAFVMRRFNFTKAEAQKIEKYCKASLKQLVGSDFSDLPFGYFFHAAVHEVDQLVLPEDGGTIATQFTATRNSRLCANFTSPYGCEATWQPMLAQFTAQFDRMKAEEPARTARAREEARQRFAPLKAAWARKVASIAAHP